MLSRLHVQNIGIIDDVEIEFNDGFNAITGETGSGKTLLIDSINLVTGNRTNREVIRNGKDKAFIQACFFCELPGISEDGQIILSREIFANGKNICKVNGKIVTLSQVKEIGDNLIDIHGQHDITYLLNDSNHIYLLDNFIGVEIENMKIEYLEMLDKQKNLIGILNDMLADPEERIKKLEFLRYQYDEISAAELIEQEEEELINKKNMLVNFEKLYSSLCDTNNILSNEVIDNLNKVMHILLAISKYDERYQVMFDQVQSAFYNLKEINSDVENDLNNNNMSEYDKEYVFKRLDEIFKLKRKYGNTIPEILVYFENISKEIHMIEDSEHTINSLNKELKDITEKLFYLCIKMNNIRTEYAKLIEKSVNSQFDSLEMPKAKFSIQVIFNNGNFEFDPNIKYQFNKNGLNDVEFRICTNIGGKVQSIAKIASGGELARVMLALKTSLVDSYQIPTIIFDEIDTGMSGQASVAVGEKLKVISQKHQVIAITHHANTAALANNNIYVRKEVIGEETVTKALNIDGQDKINEIARILSGNKITEAVLNHAKELVENEI